MLCEPVVLFISSSSWIKFNKRHYPHYTELTKKWAYLELFSLLPQVIKNKDDLKETVLILTSKWNYLLPSEDNFESELIRWKQQCDLIVEDKSITTLLSEGADPIIFPTVRELRLILAVLPMASAEAERSFFCIRKINTWSRINITNETLGNLGVLALHSFN